MKDFPVNVDLMCRFRSAAEQKKTIEKPAKIKDEAEVTEIGAMEMVKGRIMCMSCWASIRS